ncbi:MAG: SLC13 family permease [Chloroflexota bacterium]
MTSEIILVLTILGVSVILFVSEKLRVDIIAMLVLIALKLTNLITIEEAFSGFASPAVITVWSVYIVSGGLFRSGVADVLARFMLRIAGESYIRILFVIMVTVGIMSTFMNNIGAVAILLPAVISISRKINIAPSKLLIPLAFTSLLGGNMTLIGTPPNILATSLMESYGGLEPFTFFDFTPMGAIVLVTGILYFMFIGRHLLPERTPGGQLTEVYSVRDYLSEVKVGTKSSLAGKTLVQSMLGERYGLNVIQIHRDEVQALSPLPDRIIQIGDILLLQGSSQSILAASEDKGLEPLPGADTGLITEEQRKREKDHGMVEITLAPRSSLEGKTLQQADFRNGYGLSVLAIQHGSESLISDLAEVPLAFGDALLVRGPVERIARLRADKEFMILESPQVESRNIKKAPLASLILLAVLMAVSMRFLHVSIAMLIGAIMMVITGVLDMDKAYESIEWKSVFLIAGMLPMGIAMQNTGTALFLANTIIGFVGDYGPMAVVMGIFLLTNALTEVMSNAAATVLVVPIAIDAARALSVNPRTFIMAVILAAATSFLMPIGHQANVLVFGPGGYRFSDYPKVGVLLNLIILVVVTIFLPIVWPL